MSSGGLLNPDKLTAAVLKMFFGLLAFLFLMQFLLTLLCRMSVVDIGMALTCAVIINAATLRLFGGNP